MEKQQINAQARTRTQQKGSIKKPLLITLLLIAGVIALAPYMLPQGYQTDTTQIGKGKPAIVIIYDGDNAVSDELMENYSEVRGEFEAEIAFILVDIEAPGGREFAKTYDTPTSSVLFFDSKGNRITTIYTPLKTDVLKKSIRQIFEL